MKLKVGTTTIFLTYSIDDLKGKPHGFIWLTLVVLRGPRKKSPPNRRLFPVGWAR